MAEIQLFENLMVQENLNIEKITFTVVQMKYLAMHITRDAPIAIFLADSDSFFCKCDLPRTSFVDSDFVSKNYN